MEQSMMYKCYRCNRWFKVGMNRCGVLHTSNECCHHGEKEATIALVNKHGTNDNADIRILL